MEKFSIAELPGTVYLAHRDFKKQLIDELGKDIIVHDRLIIVAQPNFPQSPSRPVAKSPTWSQDTWHEPVKIVLPSISQAARALKSLGKNWVNFPVAKFRRAALIQEQLPKFKVDRIEFPQKVALPNFGCWALIDDNIIVASINTEKNMPLGEYEFVENKTLPPNRAYLKLWEVFTALGRYPQTGERCLDLGSSPGGWTWVLQSLGASVVSVDKAPLDDKILKLPGVDYLQKSAFALDPKEVGEIDWFCSDVICYPDRLLKLIHQWLEAGVCRNFICTLKLQGETDYGVLEKFKQIPHSHLLHLYHNKHELTLFSCPY